VVLLAVLALLARRCRDMWCGDRIDQKTCLKSITAANLVPVVVELQRQRDWELVTDVTGIQTGH